MTQCDIWKQTKYENYVINIDGVVKNKTTNHIKKHVITSVGYPGISVYKGKLVHIHRLVSEVFIPNPENKPEVNHIDGNKLNYNVNNLEWVTSSENKKHAYATGLRKPSHKSINAGVSHPRIRFTMGEMENIKKIILSGCYRLKDIAKVYRMNKDHISQIKRGLVWRFVIV